MAQRFHRAAVEPQSKIGAGITAAEQDGGNGQRSERSLYLVIPAVERATIRAQCQSKIERLREDDKIDVK